MRLIIAMLYASLLMAPVLTEAQVPLRLPEPASDSPPSIERLIDRAKRRLVANDPEGALQLLYPFLESARSSRQAPEVMHPVLELEALALLVAGEPAAARVAFIRLTSSEFVNENDWAGRAESAARLQDMDAYVDDLIVIIRQWPELFSKIPYRNYMRLVEKISDSHPGSPAYRRFLDVLAKEAAFTPQAANVSRDWRRLTLDYIEAGDLDEAALAASNISRVWALISMRADRRFDPLTTAAPELFDVVAAAEAEVRHATDYAALHPRSLSAVDDVAWALWQAGRVEEALEVVDSAISMADPAIVEQPYWDDQGELNWTLDRKARLLEALGRWDEAAAQYSAAIEMSEDGTPNVSQIINLASLYAALGNPELARAVLDRLPNDGTTDFGDAQAIAVELSIALQQEDQRNLRRSLRRLRSLEDAASMTLMIALTRAGESEEAAQMLIRSLRDADERLSMLIDLQDYRPLPTPPGSPHFPTLRSLLDRPDVAEVLDEVGRVEYYDVLQ